DEKPAMPLLQVPPDRVTFAASRVNGPPSVVSTKKLKLSPACTEPIVASVICALPRRVTETDCGGKISQSGSVHVVGVLLFWTPRPLSARVLGGISFSVRLRSGVLFTPPVTGAPLKPCATTCSPNVPVNVTLAELHTKPGGEALVHAGFGALPKITSAFAAGLTT